MVRKKTVLVYLTTIIGKVGKSSKKEVEMLLNKETSTWAKEAWDWAINNKITDGKRPKDVATREEVITLIHRAKGG